MVDRLCELLARQRIAFKLKQRCEEASMREGMALSVHAEYCRKLREIGSKLGYNSEKVKTPLGFADVMWLKKIWPFSEGIEMPVAVFEVVSSEDQKTLRTSLMNMLSMQPLVAVFVLIKDEIKKHVKRTDRDMPEQWLDRINKYVDNLTTEYSSFIRIEKWEEKKVEQLYIKHCST